MEVISKHRNIRKKPKQVAGHRPRTGRQKTVRTPEPVTNGFLRHSFLPLYAKDAPPQGSAIERDFFASLEKVQQEFKLNKVDISGKPYPYNIVLALTRTQQQLDGLGKDITLSIQEDETGETCLSVTEMYNTGNTLYYIPILPLYRLCRDKKQKQTAELLLSICCYLYHSAAIPYYRDQEYTYIGKHYECIAEWWTESVEDDEDMASDISELNAASYYGDVMHRRIYNLYHLNVMEQRINGYIPKSDLQQEVLKVAKQALGLLNEYPNQSVFRNTDFEDELQYDDEVIQAQQYISFIAETSGTLYQQMEQGVNAEFGECNITEQPTLTKFYNSRYQKSDNTLDFEYRLFDLLDNLCFIFNNLP